jgi:hypothetical protein
MNFNEALIAVKGSTALSNPRTTFMGIISIILGIASLLHVQISGVTFTGDPWFMISTGIGLIFAKDSATHSTLPQVEHATVVATTAKVVAAKVEADKVEALKP